MKNVLRGIVSDVIEICWEKYMESRQKQLQDQRLFVVVIEDVITGEPRITYPCSNELARAVESETTARLKRQQYKREMEIRVELYDPEIH